MMVNTNVIPSSTGLYWSNRSVNHYSGPFSGTYHDSKVLIDLSNLASLLQCEVQHSPQFNPNMLLDKGYFVITSHSPYPILPIKGNDLIANQLEHNSRVSKDLVIVERWLDRHKKLWVVTFYQFPLSLRRHDMIYRFCTCLSNINIRFHQASFVKYRKKVFTKRENHLPKT